jgi:hypothetical protein
VSKQAERSRSQESQRLLAGQIARLPDAQPPPGLVDAIMGRIQPKKRPWWQIWMRRIQTPWTALPLQAVPVAVAIILIVGGVAVFKGPWGGPAAPPSDQAGLAPVTLVLEWPTARKVAVIGSFNHWNPEGHQMHRDTPEGPWRLILELSQGRYAYAFLIDDHWHVPDPHSLLQQDDGFGNFNSALIVEKGKPNANEI